MTQLEQIEARAAEAERNTTGTPSFFFAGEAHAYAQAAALARPLQEGIDALRFDIWELFELEAIGCRATQLLKNLENKAREDGDEAAQKFNGEHARRSHAQTQAYYTAARMLHDSLEQAGLS